MFYTLVRKDLLLELRTKEIIIPMFAFGLAIIMIFSLFKEAFKSIILLLLISLEFELK